MIEVMHTIREAYTSNKHRKCPMKTDPMSIYGYSRSEYTQVKMKMEKLKSMQNDPMQTPNDVTYISYMNAICAKYAYYKF